ncbi:unnamed protein product, partial [Brassica oleracea]
VNIKFKRNNNKCVCNARISRRTICRHHNVDGQSLNAGKETCKQIKCNKDKNLTCPCCVFKTENWYKCYKSMEECSRFCGKRS